MVTLPDKGKLIKTADRERRAMDRVRELVKSINLEMRQQFAVSDVRYKRGENTILQDRRVEVLRARLDGAVREWWNHGLAFSAAEYDLRRHWKRERYIERMRKKKIKIV
jgi:hypothetical protein